MDDGRMMEGRRLDGYTISSPCEPNGSGELKTRYSLQQQERTLVSLVLHSLSTNFPVLSFDRSIVELFLISNENLMT